MLVLGRKVNDGVKIIVDDVVICEITYCANKGKQIKLSFNAPKDVRIVRSELTDQKLTEVR